MERINRDLAKVIVVDWNSSWMQSHLNNTLIIPRWNGDDNDNSLIDLADFLKGLIVYYINLKNLLCTFLSLYILKFKFIVSKLLIQLINNIYYL